MNFITLQTLQLSMFSPLQTIFVIVIMIPTAIAALKGAPFVPTPWPAVKKMIKIAKIKPTNTIYDLGCGDGRIVYLASQQTNQPAIGYELSPLVYFLAKIRQFLWGSKALIQFRDFRKVNLGQANVIFCYLLINTLKIFQTKFETELKPGTKIISYAFKIGDWKEIHHEPADKKLGLASIWVYEIGKTK